MNYTGVFISTIIVLLYQFLKIAHTLTVRVDVLLWDAGKFILSQLYFQTNLLCIFILEKEDSCVFLSCKQLHVKGVHPNVINGVKGFVRLHHAPNFNARHCTILSIYSGQVNELLWMQVRILLLLVFVDDGLSAPRVEKPNVSHRLSSLFKLNLLKHGLLDLLMVKRWQINLKQLGCSSTHDFEEQQIVSHLLMPKPLRISSFTGNMCFILWCLVIVSWVEDH